jgi:chromosome segregation ATPase
MATLQEIQTQFSKATTIKAIQSATKELLANNIESQVVVNQLKTDNDDLKKELLQIKTTVSNTQTNTQTQTNSFIAIDESKLPTKPSDSWYAPSCPELELEMSKTIQEKRELEQVLDSDIELKKPRMIRIDEIETRITAISKEMNSLNAESYNAYQKQLENYQKAVDKVIENTKTTFNIIK